MKKNIIFIVLITIAQISFGQKNSKLAARNRDVKLGYSKMYKYADSLFQHTKNLNACLSGYMSVKFTVDTKGYVKNIQTSEGSPDFLEGLIKSILSKSNGEWKSTVISKSYILPIYYNLRYNCPVDTSSKKMSPLEGLLKNIPNDTSPNKDGKVYSFLNITNFKKTKDMLPYKTQPPIDCILLSPFELSDSVIHERWEP